MPNRALAAPIRQRANRNLTGTSGCRSTICPHAACHLAPTGSQPAYSGPPPLDMSPQWCYYGDMNTPSTEPAQIVRRTLRLPRDVVERLTRLAVAHDRSLNREIVRALRQYVEQSAEARETPDERETSE